MNDEGQMIKRMRRWRDTPPPERPPVTYFGGPLDGQTATRTGTRWSIYRNEEGQPVPTARGDRDVIHRQNRGEDPRPLYVRQGVASGECYVHTSALDAWRRSREEQDEA